MTDTQMLAAETAERALLGSLLIDRDAIVAVSDRITSEAFSTARNRAIYAAIQRCWDKRIAPDISAVHVELANDPLFGRPDDWMHAAQDLADAIFHVLGCGFGTHAPFYADQVVAFARKRAMNDAGIKIVRLANGTDDIDPNVAIHEALSDLDRFGATTEHRGPVTYDEIIPAYQERIMRMKSGEIPYRVTATGYHELDRKLDGGLYPGELVTIAGRTGMGKTAFALNIAHQVANRGKHVLIFSAEMSKEALIKRAVMDVSGVTASENSLNDSEFDQYLQALERLRSLPVSIDDTSGITTAQMLVRVQQVQRQHDLGLVMFDYIDLAGDGSGSENEQQRITGIVRRLKHLARVCDVPVVELAQINRQVEGRSNKRPSLHDLRASGSIEQESDKVLFIYREAYYAAMGHEVSVSADRSDVAEIIVAKHRQGATGSVDLHFKGDTMSFHNISHGGYRSAV